MSKSRTKPRRVRPRPVRLVPGMRVGTPRRNVLLTLSYLLACFVFLLLLTT